MKTRAVTTAAALILSALAALGQATGAITNKAELRAALATARTAADHARIAAYYRETARTYTQKQAEEEQIAARLAKQYEGWTKSPNPYRSAVNLAGYYRQQARDASARAAKQDRLAGN